jgi:hemoglobin
VTPAAATIGPDTAAYAVVLAATAALALVARVAVGRWWIGRDRGRHASPDDPPDGDHGARDDVTFLPPPRLHAVPTPRRRERPAAGGGRDEDGVTFLTDIPDRDRLERHLTHVLMAALGPRRYTGRDIAAAHADHRITDAAFDRALGHVVAVLAEIGVPQAWIGEVGAAVAPLRASIVTAPPRVVRAGAAPGWS